VGQQDAQVKLISLAVAVDIFFRIGDTAAGGQRWPYTPQCQSANTMPRSP